MRVPTPTSGSYPDTFHDVRVGEAFYVAWNDGKDHLFMCTDLGYFNGLEGSRHAAVSLSTGYLAWFCPSQPVRPSAHHVVDGEG
jgi:hypothetical protein